MEAVREYIDYAQIIKDAGLGNWWVKLSPIARQCVASAYQAGYARAMLTAAAGKEETDDA